jgi:hypothetical protein
MARRAFTLVTHTHWDREWYEPFEIFRAQLVEVLDAALDDLSADPRHCFTLDGQVALVDDYLALRPEAEPRLREAVRSGRLRIGPFYTQADSLLVDGEGLIRNLARGIARAEAIGRCEHVAYMADQFGHAAQLPQLLALFGLSTAVLWRGVGPARPPSSFVWRAPDGSRVETLWLQDGYGSGRRYPSDPAGFVAAVERHLERHGAWLQGAAVVLPIGDDHVRLATWAVHAAEALGAAHPELDVQVAGYAEHFGHAVRAEHEIVGELRSPAFAPVLAGVASARVREKQAAARVTQLLLRATEPLAAWATRLGGHAPGELVRRAWELAVLNQAHDSAAGCGADATHLDVAARFRWAEQAAAAARDRVTVQLGLEPGEGFGVLAFVPVRGDSAVVEAELPKSLAPPLVAVGADGVARPVQLLAAADERPLFEGEFSAADLEQHLGGLDPATPIFGRFLTGLHARDEGGGVMRLDVGLGSAPAHRKALAADQARLSAMLGRIERFKVFLHDAAPTRRALLAVGPGGDARLTQLRVHGGTPEGASVGALDDARPGIMSGEVRVIATADGVAIEDGPLRVLAAGLVDDGDRGDLYHAQPVPPSIHPGAATAKVIERGPLRACLRLHQRLELPEALADDRRSRAGTAPLSVTTDVTVHAGSRRVDFVVTLRNVHRDHRLRALVRAPFVAERFDVEHGLAVLARPFDAAAALGAGAERAAPTGQHHLFVDVGAGDAGVALMSRGLLEHEVTRERGETQLLLTMLRSVGWLARGDLDVIDHAAGPMLPTPDAQELGEHRFEYALLLHRGDWRQGGVLDEARRYQAPALAWHARGSVRAPRDAALVQVTPQAAILTALHPAADGHGLIARVLNTAATETDVRLAPWGGCHEAGAVDPLGRAIASPVWRVRDGVAEASLRAWQLATVWLR